MVGRWWSGFQGRARPGDVRGRRRARRDRAPGASEEEPEVISHVPGGGVPFFRPLRKCFLADPFQFLGDRVVDLAGRTRLRLAISSRILRLSIAPEGLSSGQQLVENDTQAEDVGSPVDPVTFTPGLLGAHVGRCAGHPPALPKSSSLRRKSEIGEEGLARGVDQDVRGLDVPVDQASAVGVVQGVGDRGNQLRRIPVGKTRLADPGRQITAFDELRDDEAETVRPCGPHPWTGTMLGWSSLATMRASREMRPHRRDVSCVPGSGTLIATGRLSSSS